MVIMDWQCSIIPFSLAIFLSLFCFPQFLFFYPCSFHSLLSFFKSCSPHVSDGEVLRSNGRFSPCFSPFDFPPFVIFSLLQAHSFFPLITSLLPFLLLFVVLFLLLCSLSFNRFPFCPCSFHSLISSFCCELWLLMDTFHSAILLPLIFSPSVTFFFALAHFTSFFLPCFLPHLFLIGELICLWTISAIFSPW